MVVQKICEMMEVKFSEDFLHWESMDDFDPNWEVEIMNRDANVTHGFYTRAHASTGFEDIKEREVDLTQFQHRPDLISAIERSTKIYDQTLAIGKDL